MSDREEILIHRFLAIASLLLLALGLVYLVYGGHKLFTEAGDFRTRWVEQHYVFEGKNPIDIYEQAQARAEGKSIPNHGRDATIDPRLGPTQPGGYPPWAYFTGAALTWPSSFVAARIMYGLLNLVVLAALLLWAYRLGKISDPVLGLFFAASVLSINSICTTFIVGQYGVLVLATLVAAYVLDEKGRWFTSGLSLALALTKVTLAGPFLLPFLIKGRWRLLIVSGGYLLVASMVIWPVIQTSPVEMLQQMLRSSEGFQEKGYSLNNLLEYFGLAVQPATKLAELGCPLIAAVILYLWRSSSMLTQYAIVALAARAWCYHRLYDNLVLVFILLDLGIITWKTRSLVGCWTYLLFGLTLWVPGRFTNADIWMVTQWVAWVGGLSVLLYLRRSEITPIKFSAR